MLIAYDVREAAQKLEAENHRFRRFLKTHADEDTLDQQFLELHKELFESYDCSKCRNCCRAYDVSLEDREIAAIAAAKGFTPDALCKQYLVEGLCGYLYYIAMCEPLADEEQIQFCREYINRNCNHFKQLIISCGIYHMSSDDIKLSYELMRAWEVTKINCVKTLVFDSVANDFWTFSSLVAEPSGYSLFDTLGKIAAGNEFKLYSQYFADHTTSKCTRQKYKDFCDLFGFTFDEAAISLLKSFLSEMYKQSSIQEAEREHRELIENTDFLPEQICMIKEYCEQLSNRFSDRSSEIVSDHITLFNSNEFCFELSRKGNERLQNMIKASILAAVCRTIMPNIRTSEVNFGEPVTPIIEELKASMDGSLINTAIGSKNCFSYRERNEEKRIIEEFGENFLSGNIRDALFFISQTGFFVDFNNIDVRLRNITREEILTENTPDKNGIYPYVITNRLMGYFTEDELVKFVQNRQVILEGTCDLKHGFSSDCIGYGIILRQTQE